MTEEIPSTNPTSYKKIGYFNSNMEYKEDTPPLVGHIDTYIDLFGLVIIFDDNNDFRIEGLTKGIWFVKNDDLCIKSLYFEK